MAEKNEEAQESAGFSFPVERGHIMQFAAAVGDDNPIYYDEEYAKKTKLGAIIASPTFVQISAHWQRFAPQRPGAPAGMPRDMRRVLHGEQEYEYLQPVKAGDTLTVTSRIADSYDKEGKRGGKLTFTIVEITYTNQKGEVAVIARSTGIVTGQVVKDE